MRGARAEDGRSEQRTVDIGEGREVSVKIGGAVRGVGIEHLKQMRQLATQIMPVIGGAGFKIIPQQVARIEDAGIIGEQAEHDAGQEALKIMAADRRGQRIVQLADQLGGGDIGGRLGTGGGRRVDIADEPERLHMFAQVLQGKGDGLAGVTVKQFEILEIADKLEPGAIPLRQGIEIGGCLDGGGLEVTPGGLLFDDQGAGPEQVDEARCVVQASDVFLVPGDGLAGDAEKVEEVVVERLRLALFIVGGPVGAREGCGADADIVPAVLHRSVMAGGRASGKVAGAERLELTTAGFGIQCSTN